MLTELEELLPSLDPRLDPATYVFCTVRTRQEVPWASDRIIAVIREAEAYTLVVEQAEAKKLGFDAGDAFRRISLGVHSSLHAVGLTAVAARALADRGISANVIAGFYHDHFMVPAASADEALDALESLAKIGSGDY